MSSSTYFLQGCPTCGRRARVRVEHLGRLVVCTHCHGRFEARDPATQEFDGIDPSDSVILRRANELLATLEDPMRVRPR
jgi:hypothetical protein